MVPPLPLRISSKPSEGARQEEWRDELLRTGIRGKGGQYIRFGALGPLPNCRWLHADGHSQPDAEPASGAQRIAVSFGPAHAPLEQRQVEQALEEARQLVPCPEVVVFAAFQFDPEAAKDIDETNWPGITLLKAQMNADLLTDDLKKKRVSNQSFWLVGQPDVAVERNDEDAHGEWQVEVRGFDYYDTQKGELVSGGRAQIALWMLDPDYDGRSLFPRQVFFPGEDRKEGWGRLAKNLRAEIDHNLIEEYRGTRSLPFKTGDHRRVAVKVVDMRGIESLRIVGLDV